MYYIRIGFIEQIQELTLYSYPYGYSLLFCNKNRHIIVAKILQIFARWWANWHPVKDAKKTFAECFAYLDNRYFTFTPWALCLTQPITTFKVTSVSMLL